jgi:hypothetical protein
MFFTFLSCYYLIRANEFWKGYKQFCIASGNVMMVSLGINTIEKKIGKDADF